MAQAMVEKDMKTFPLSDVLHVTAIKQSQVQFINKPAEKAISETSVNFTTPHWISCWQTQNKECNQGRNTGLIPLPWKQ